jgi:hypothetical protein
MFKLFIDFLLTFFIDCLLFFLEGLLELEGYCVEVGGEFLLEAL